MSQAMGRGSKAPITKDTPLSVAEQHFLTNYIKCGNYAEAAIMTPELDTEGKTRNACKMMGRNIMKRPNILAELDKIMEEARKETIAEAKEVMEYFTRVMRGEEKDQFGLEAALAERTKAAQELARRTIDIENKVKGVPDQQIEIKIDWSRDKEEE